MAIAYINTIINIMTVITVIKIIPFDFQVCSIVMGRRERVWQRIRLCIQYMKEHLKINQKHKGVYVLSTYTCYHYQLLHLCKTVLTCLQGMNKNYLEIKKVPVLILSLEVRLHSIYPCNCVLM